MTDYLGNEIHVGDIVVYTNGTTTDYPYSEAVVIGFFKRKGHSYLMGDAIMDYVEYEKGSRKGYRQGHSLINLTALGVRPRSDTNAAE